jgi:hypothetical protein
MNKASPEGRDGLQGMLGSKVDGGYQTAAAGERVPANPGSAVENWNAKGEVTS